MAPKRQRGESSRSSQTYDKKRFMSLAASERFHKVTSTKTLIQERGFDPSLSQGQLKQMIRDRRWRTFVSQPEPAVEFIVREFYANAIEAEHNVVNVRGKDVSFSPEAINEYYGLPDIPEDEYIQYKNNELNLDEVLHGLCQPAATWKYTGNEPVNFLAKHLSRFGKAWYCFLCAKLMPTTHISEIIKERAILLYCLVHGKSINVGKVIHGSIKHVLDGGSTGGLPHPSLICGLCDLAGVTWDETEPLQKPRALLDAKLIRQLKQWDGAPADPRGAGYIMNPPIREDPPAREAPHSPDTEELFAASPASAAHAAGPSTFTPVTENEFSIEMQRFQTSVNSQFQEITRQNRRLAQRQDTMHSYNVNFNTALVEMFARLHPAQDTTQFPAPNPMPGYPPSDSEEDNA